MLTLNVEIPKPYGLTVFITSSLTMGCLDLQHPQSHLRQQQTAVNMDNVAHMQTNTCLEEASCSLLLTMLQSKPTFYFLF